MTAKKLTLADIIPTAEYALSRRALKEKMIARKRQRRVSIGPFVTFYFECFDSMWLQVQEMLYIERAAPEQAVEEIAAYAPLVPNGRELVATFMIEINDPVRRARELAHLGAIEDTAFLRFAGHEVLGMPEMDQDRTTADGKASAVQFVHFPFTDDQVAAFSAAGASVILGLNHTHYKHMTVLDEAVRVELASDFA
jgi:hypothetical protein